jgi:hypothetical protein
MIEASTEDRRMFRAAPQTDVIGHSSSPELGKIQDRHKPTAHEIKQGRNVQFFRSQDGGFAMPILPKTNPRETQQINLPK